MQKSKTIWISVSQKGFGILQDLAEKARLSIAAFIRYTLFNKQDLGFSKKDINDNNVFDPKRDGIQVFIKMSGEDHKALKDLAIENETTIATVVRSLLLKNIN